MNSADANTKKKVSDYIVEFFDKHGVDKVFGYMGGMVTHLADSIDKNKNMKFIPVYHEQTAAFAAVGYAKSSNKIGVAIATSGPGATNLMTGIADAYFDSIPCIFITGQVNSYEYKYDKPIRQYGFQELDVVSSVSSFCKYATYIDNADEIPEILQKAYEIAMSGRRGPVVLDIPMNIQRSFINAPQPKTKIVKSVSSISPEASNSLVGLLKKSTRPLVLIGGGFSGKNGLSEKLIEYLVKFKLPFVSSLLGKTFCDEYHELYLGCIGSYGHRCANMAMANTDLLLVLGSRLDIRQVGGVANSIAIGGTIVHFDIDVGELEHGRLVNKVNICADIEAGVSVIIDFLNKNQYHCGEWNNYLAFIKNKYSQVNEIKLNVKDDAPYQLMEMLNRKSSDDAVYYLDVGQNQMWAMQMLKLKKQQSFFTSGGLGSMACAIPSAIGVAFADKSSREVYAICGDGGFHMSIQSLLLIAQYNLPIKVIVINNKSLGMITQFQELYFENNTVGTNNSGGYLVPDIEYLAKGYGLEYIRFDTTKNSNCSLEECFTRMGGLRNCILEYVISEDCKVYPKLEYNQPIYNPSPSISASDLEADMFVTLIKSADHE